MARLTITILCLASVALAEGSGFPHANSRIVGGGETVPHSHPYQVGMFLKVWGVDKEIFCGGSILNKYYILTAAHCLYGAYHARVILGAHNIQEDEPTQQQYNTTVFIIHRGWNPRLLTDDIGLVKISTPMPFNKAVRPVTLPTSSDMHKTFSFQDAVVTGWGKTANKDEAIHPTLKEMHSKVTQPLVCKLFFFGKTGKNQMCVDGINGNSTCQGDSGGPLVIVDEDGTPVQQGIVSFGIGFGCEVRWPQVFTKVSRYLKWIYEHTGIPIKP